MEHKEFTITDFPNHILESVSRNNTYAGALPFKEIDGDWAVFGGDFKGEMRWGEEQGNRDIVPPEFRVDKRYWELIGKPDPMVVVMQTIEDNEKETKLYMFLLEKKREQEKNGKE